MYSKYLIIPLSIIALSLTSCGVGNEPKQLGKSERTTVAQPSIYVAKYTGAYLVEVNGVSNDYETEGYALKDDGTATWMWIENDGANGATLKQKKYGTWISEIDKIHISINGQSGPIEEVYVLKDGEFINTDNPNRKLRKGPQYPSSKTG
jgi:hypothetical protein